MSMEYADTTCLQREISSVTNSLEDTLRVVDLMKEHGVPATHMGIGSDLLPAKYISIKSGLKKLQVIQDNMVHGISLVHSPDKGSSPTFDWLFLTSYSVALNNNELRDTCSTGILNDPAIHQFLAELIGDTLYDHGYRTKVEKRSFPELFSMGGSTPTNTVQAAEFDAWGRYRMSDELLNARIRDVFPINMFNDAQLGAVIKDKAFSAILLEHGAVTVGSLAGLTEIAIPEERIEPIRSLLRGTGFAISLV